MNYILTEELTLDPLEETLMELTKARVIVLPFTPQFKTLLMARDKFMCRPALETDLNNGSLVKEAIRYKLLTLLFPMR